MRDTNLKIGLSSREQVRGFCKSSILNLHDDLQELAGINLVFDSIFKLYPTATTVRRRAVQYVKEKMREDRI